MLPSTLFKRALQNPYYNGRTFSPLHQEFDRLFSGLGSSRASAFPVLELWSDEEKAVVTAELPGFGPGDIEVSVEKAGLSLKGERRAEEADQSQTYHRQERWIGAFERLVGLPFAVEADAIKATFKDGVLTIELPRAAQDKPKKITVKAA